MILGITLAMMEERGKPLLDFFTCMSEAMMQITTWVIYMAPIGVFFLIGGQILEMEDMSLVSIQVHDCGTTKTGPSFFFCTLIDENL